MNTWHIVGVVVVAIGTLIMIFGSHIASKKQGDSSTEAIKQKLDEFRAEVQAAKQLPADEAVAKMESIENSFTNWAKNLPARKDTIKLEYRELRLKREQGKLAREKADAELNRLLRQNYQAVLTTLEDMLKAYNETTEHKVIYNIPEVPLDLRNVPFREYEATVSFGQTKWIIHIYNWFRLFEEVWAPEILVFRVSSETDRVSKPESRSLGISSDREERFYVGSSSSSPIRDKLPIPKTMDDTAPTGVFLEKAKDVVRIAVEYELAHR